MKTKPRKTKHKEERLEEKREADEGEPRTKNEGLRGVEVQGQKRHEFLILLDADLNRVFISKIFDGCSGMLSACKPWKRI